MYDPIAYWTEAGKTYADDFAAGRTGSGYAEQEAALLEVLAGLEFTTVLDVGCGFGRIARLIADRWPSVEITGIDLSTEQLERARELVPEATLRHATLQGFNSRGQRWDLVLASEVLMHVRPRDVDAAVAKLRRLTGRHLVTLDWCVPLAPGKPIAPWNFRHDYAALGLTLVRTVGLQGIFRAQCPEDAP